MRRRILWGVLAVTAAGGALALPRHPAVLAWRYKRMSVAELEKTRQGRFDDAALVYQLGMRLNAAGRFSDADPLLRNAVERNPDDTRLRDAWTTALLGSQRVAAAYAQLKQFAGTHPNVAEAHLLLGRFYVTQVSMERAVTELKEAIRLNPNLGEAYGYLAAAHAYLEEYPLATEAARSATRLQPNDHHHHLVLASLLERATQTAEASTEYNTALRLAPKDPFTSREYARFLFEHATTPEQRDVAVKAVQAAAALAPKEPRVATLLGQAYLSIDKAAEAVPPLEAASEADKNDVAGPLALVQAYRRLGNTAKADQWDQIYRQRRVVETERKLLYEAIKDNPKAPGPHEKMAKLLARRGDTDECIKHFAAAQQKGLDSVTVLVAAANALSEGGYPEKALPLARHAVEVTQSSPFAHEALGNAYLKLDRVLQAGQSYQMASGLLPRLKPILEKRVADYNAQKAKTRTPAEAAFQKALELERFYLGPQKLGDDVLEQAKKAVALAPDNTTYLGYLLRIQTSRGENDAALETATRLNKLAPDDANVHVRLAILLLEKAHTEAEFNVIEAHLNTASTAELTDNATVALREYGQGLLAMQRGDGATAVIHLQNAAKADPEPSVTYYKLAQAQKMAGNDAAAQKSLDYFHLLREEQQAEGDALGAIAHEPTNAALYQKAVELFRAHEKPEQASAIQAEANRRFGKGPKP